MKMIKKTWYYYQAKYKLQKVYILAWFELLNLNLDYKNENIPALTWWEMDTKTKERKNAFLKYWSWAAILKL